MTAYRVAEALHAAPGGSIDLRFFNEDGHLKSPNEIGSESDKILYGRQLQAYMSNRSAALGDAFGALDNAYNHGTGAIK